MKISQINGTTGKQKHAFSFALSAIDTKHRQFNQPFPQNLVVKNK
jgi:hypothetical protein